MDKEYSVKVYFSDNHTSYFDTWTNVTKTDLESIYDKEHPDLTISSWPCTTKGTKIKCKRAEGAGKFRIKNKRNLDLTRCLSLHKKSKLQIWSHLLKKSLMENFIFCAVSEIMFARSSSFYVYQEKQRENWLRSLYF